MINLSIILPDTIAEASTKVAKELGVSRTEFIRRAIIHELDNYKTKSEELGIIKSFNAMKKSTKYSKASQKLIDSLFKILSNSDLRSCPILGYTILFKLIDLQCSIKA